MIQATSLTLGYDPQQPLLHRASLSIGAGTMVALLGRNGAGKSTLLRSIAGLQTPLEGSIKLNGVDVSTMSEQQRATQVSLVTTERVRIPNLSCRTLVALGRSPHTNWLGSLTTNDHRVINHAIEQVQMSHLADKPCSKLSDGELQRIMIARALAQETPIIMLDEPTAFLDMPSRHQLLKLLSHIAHNEGKTLLLSTHELDLAIESCDTIALLKSPDIALLPSREAETKLIINNYFGLSSTL